MCYDVEGVSSNDNSEDEFANEPEESKDMHESADPTTPFEPRKDPIQSEFDLNGPNIVSPALVEPDDLKTDPPALMLRWHHRLSHISMKRIQLMALNGQLPKSLATC
jgi:hypothetical protein